jgi:type III restriction enzyme
MILQKEYQINAITELMGKIVKSLKSASEKVVVFKAPTGSGKTYMMSEAVKRLVEDKENNFALSFIWLSVRMLHEQSKEKLEKYYEDFRTINCSYFEDLKDNKIQENEILFINWHSINKKNINIYVRENELDNDLNSVIRNTKDDGREIVLIIDESHHTANSDKSRELITSISPKVTIEVSATPEMKTTDELVSVDIERVKEEHMIKSEIAVNPHFMGIVVTSRSSDEIVIEQALKKREELLEACHKEGSKVNPLLLIQLPDKKGEMDTKKDEIVDLLDKKFGINESKGNLAIWLSEEKTESLKNIERNDNQVEVLIFKQAIALGWDCPRASVLVIFRESTSFRFTIQTVGRIMRMPELKYYNTESLNNGYIFTNLQEIKIVEDYAKDYITTNESKRRVDLYTQVSLRSIYIKRQLARERLSSPFIDIFEKIAKEVGLDKKITLEPSAITNLIISDGKIINIDTAGQIESEGELEVALTSTEINRRFDLFVWENCRPFAPVYSRDRMKSALYSYFVNRFAFSKLDPRVQKVVLGKENIDIFKEVLSESKERYIEEVVEQLRSKKEVCVEEAWEVPFTISYNSKYEKQNRKRSIMEPYFLFKNASQPEKDFIEVLDKSDKVEWWFKNREGTPKYFAVEYYDENNELASFYVDFIVKFNNGIIGLYDTKKGRTAEEAKFRAEGLQKYIETERRKGKNLDGGIVVPYENTWKINREKLYEYNPKKIMWWPNLNP